MQIHNVLILQVYPDMGIAAMLKNSWTECPYKIASLIDRNPVSEDDNIIVTAAPDPLGKHTCIDLNGNINIEIYILCSIHIKLSDWIP